MHEEIRGTRPDVLIVDDYLYEERPVRLLVVDKGRGSSLLAAISACIRDSPELSGIVLVSQESESATEWFDEGQPDCYLPVHQIKAQEEEVMPSFHILMAYLDHTYAAYNHPRPKRAKRNKQTNKKKNFRR